MTQALALSRTLVGKKVVMAVTGLLLLGFLVGHMLGNLKVFSGPDRFNAYAEGLRAVGAPFLGHGQALVLVRVVLLAALVLHIWAAAAVTRASWRARPIGYRALEPVATTYAARTMRWGGVIIFAYAVYHLLDLTFGMVNPAFQPGDVYGNLVASFHRVPVAVTYIAANLILGLHVYHGLWSAFQTLGLAGRPADRWRRGVAGTAAAALTLGYVAVPLAGLTGRVG
jgi:succinate dehydrogenase / fumarate reductase cytochrome b subunit